ncbi:hypothetical protein ILUMI_14968, partial [Ignelater luminosus]
MSCADLCAPNRRDTVWPGLPALIEQQSRINFKPHMLNGSPAGTADAATKSVESVNNCTAQKLGEKTPQPSTSKESFGSNEADPPSDNFKELTDWEIRERTPEVST